MGTFESESLSDPALSKTAAQRIQQECGEAARFYAAGGEKLWDFITAALDRERRAPGRKTDFQAPTVELSRKAPRTFCAKSSAD